MSAVARPSERRLLAMRPADLDAVLEIERAVYEFPWTRGNFSDSMHAGYDMQVLMTPQGRAGYFIAMFGADEMHLLNLTVAPTEQGRGHARYMLDACARWLAAPCDAVVAGGSKSPTSALLRSTSAMAFNVSACARATTRPREAHASMPS